MKKFLLLGLILSGILISCEKDDNGTQPTANFTYELPSKLNNSDSIKFTNLSKNAISYLWDFGDGTTSTQIHPSHEFNGELPYIVSLTAFNGDKSHTLTDTIKNWTIVYKPNIYIYPEETIDICVNLDFPMGGHVIASIPEYIDGWCVTVNPTGKIDGSYDYLFYESTQPNIWQNKKGWCVPMENLSEFFTENMESYGFNPNEIEDYIAYWIPLLNDAPYYNIYPQVKSKIDKVIELSVSIKPDNVNRLFYLIEKSNSETQIDAATIIPFIKEGYYVNEWGVIRH